MKKYMLLLSKYVKNQLTNATIPNDIRNCDYQDYLKWCEEGNTPDIQTESLDELKNKKCTEVDDLLSKKENEIVYNSNIFFINTDNQVRIFANATFAILCKIDINNFVWKAPMNTVKDINYKDVIFEIPDDFLLFYKRVYEYCFSCCENCIKLKKEINELTTAEEVKAFDINIGWPK